MRRAEDVRVGRVGLLRRHLVAEAGLLHERRHLRAAAQLVDERRVQPRLVDLQVRIDEQAVAVEALNVVALEGRAVAPDVDVVFLHRRHQHGAGHSAADRRGVEVRNAGGRDVKRAGLQRRDAFAHQRPAAVDQPRLLRAILQRLARNLVVVGLVRLAEVGRVGVRNRALLLHPVQRGGGVQPAREGDADLLADGQRFKNDGHDDCMTSDRVHSRLEPLRLRAGLDAALAASCGMRFAPPSSISSSAFCACMRFSAWSKTTDCGPSSTASVTSALRCAGRQCMKTACGCACAISASFTWYGLKMGARLVASCSKPMLVQTSV